MNLAKIKIPRANLDNGIFEGANLSEADLKETKLSRCILNQCNLERALLDKVDIGIPYPDLRGHSYSIAALAISPDQKYLVSGSYDRTIKIWSLDSGLETRTLSGHTDQIVSIAITAD